MSEHQSQTAKTMTTGTLNAQTSQEQSATQGIRWGDTLSQERKATLEQTSDR